MDDRQTRDDALGAADELRRAARVSGINAWAVKSPTVGEIFRHRHFQQSGGVSARRGRNRDNGGRSNQEVRA